MAIIDQLHSTLSTRFQGAQKNVVATDFSGHTATVFATVVGTEPILFSADSTVSALIDKKFKVVGKIDVWHLGVLNFTLTIQFLC